MAIAFAYSRATGESLAFSQPSGATPVLPHNALSIGVPNAAQL